MAMVRWASTGAAGRGVVRQGCIGITERATKCSRWGGGRGNDEALCHCHLRGNRPLTLELRLVPLERLLSAALQVLTVVVLRHSVLVGGLDGKFQGSYDRNTHCATEVCTAVWALANQTKGRRVAADFSLELAALLSGHDDSSCIVLYIQLRLALSPLSAPGRKDLQDVSGMRRGESWTRGQATEEGGVVRAGVWVSEEAGGRGEQALIGPVRDASACSSARTWQSPGGNRR